MVPILGVILPFVALELQVQVIEEPFLRRLHGGGTYEVYAARVDRFLTLLGQLGSSGSAEAVPRWLPTQPGRSGRRARGWPAPMVAGGRLRAGRCVLRRRVDLRCAVGFAGAAVRRRARATDVIALCAALVATRIDPHRHHRTQHLGVRLC